MNKAGLLIAELHDAETGLARACRRVAERQAADHGTHYPCRTLAQQADERARRLRDAARRYDRDLSAPRHSEGVAAAVGALREKSSELMGRRPSSGLLLLRDLRELFLTAQAANVHWILLGQAAQALRDAELLEDTTRMHKELLTAVKWVKTRMKEAAPQVVAFGD
jgi:hypothetical protein